MLLKKQSILILILILHFYVLNVKNFTNQNLLIDEEYHKIEFQEGLQLITSLSILFNKSKCIVLHDYFVTNWNTCQFQGGEEIGRKFNFAK